MSKKLVCRAVLPVTNADGEKVAEQAQFYDPESGELAHVERRAEIGKHKEGDEIDAPEAKPAPKAPAKPKGEPRSEDLRPQDPESDPEVRSND